MILVEQERAYINIAQMDATIIHVQEIIIIAPVTHISNVLGITYIGTILVETGVVYRNIAKTDAVITRVKMFAQDIIAITIIIA
jgi:hypothetical protein